LIRVHFVKAFVIFFSSVSFDLLELDNGLEMDLRRRGYLTSVLLITIESNTRLKILYFMIVGLVLGIDNGNRLLFLDTFRHFKKTGDKQGLTLFKFAKFKPEIYSSDLKSTCTMKIRLSTSQ
jgi:hypothetical protein